MAPGRQHAFPTAHLALLLIALTLLGSIALTWQRLNARKDEVRQAQSLLRHLDRLQVATSRLVSAEWASVLSADARDVERLTEAIAALDDAVRMTQALAAGTAAAERVATVRERVGLLVEEARQTMHARLAAEVAAEPGHDLESTQRRTLEEEIRLLVDQLDETTSRAAALARTEAEQQLRALFLLGFAAAIAMAIALPLGVAGTRAREVSASRLVEISRAGVVGVAFWDTTGRLVESNAEYDRIVGMPAGAGSEPVYWTEVFVGDDSQLADAAARHVLVNGACPPFFASCRGDGTARIPVLSWSLRLETKPVEFASFVVDLSRQLSVDRPRDRGDAFTALVPRATAQDPGPHAPLAAASAI